jgi:hypothetical protein
MNRRHAMVALALTFLFLLITRTSTIAQSDSGNLEEQIKQLERDRQNSFVHNDIAALDRDTAEDYTTIGSSGKLSDKPQMMKNLKAGRTQILSMDLSDMKARVYGDTAVLTGRAREVSVTEGQQKDEQVLFMRIFVKANGRWQAVAYQQTPVAGK